jgi:transcriptional regulator with XRE-family HTH domain
VKLDRAQLGDNIRRLRRDVGMTQEDLADRLGCTNAMISQVERGRTMPSVETLAEIADILGTPYGVIFGEPLATAEHLVAEVRRQVRALGYDLALVPRPDEPEEDS